MMRVNQDSIELLRAFSDHGVELIVVGVHALADIEASTEARARAAPSHVDANRGPPCAGRAFHFQEQPDWRPHDAAVVNELHAFGVPSHSYVNSIWLSQVRWECWTKSQPSCPEHVPAARL